MLPRNRPAWLFFLVVLFLLTPVFAQDRPPSDTNKMIQFFQDHISGADGNRCPMTPSCSAYAARAIKKHGLVVGWVMALDRILRCGRSEVNLAPRRWINGEPYVYDPVSANDFWWFTPPSDPSP